MAKQNVHRPYEAPARLIGERIKQARKSRGLNQADLACRLGVSQPAIANWESGLHDPRRVMLAKLATALECPLDWLAAGDRSVAESDKQAAAAYIRRPIHHVPVISFRSAALMGLDMTADPHAMAEDYIPVTAGSSKLFALFLEDEAVNLAFPIGTLVVIDYADRKPKDGVFCLATVGGDPILRMWRDSPPRFEPASTDLRFQSISAEGNVNIIGCARVSIRIH